MIILKFAEKIKGEIPELDLNSNMIILKSKSKVL